MYDKNNIPELFEGITNGDRSALSRGITLVESRREQDRKASSDLISRCLKVKNNAVRIAISGSPGAGKSTMIEALGNHVIDHGYTLAVLAVDPSSERTRGSILGDKTRMQSLVGREGAFIRPSPSGGHLGGVARRTRETSLLCEAAGYDYIFIETVGVGQSEIAAYQMADLFMLLILPGAGDELQGIKRGIVELADMIVINKADGENLTAAKKSKQEYSRAVHLFPEKPSGIPTKVLLASGITGTGIPELWNEVSSYIQEARTGGAFETRRKDQALTWFKESFQDQLLDRLDKLEGFTTEKERLKKAVMEGKITPFQGADELAKWIRW